MRTALPKQTPPTRSHRPRAVTVFAAAFVAGAAAAVGVNRTLDVRMAQSKPRVESEAIFVALRSLPQGSPVTVWDVALRDWPKAMMPATALRASDTFSGHVLKHPLREGQPLLSVQLAPASQSVQPAAEPTVFPPPAAYTQSGTPVVPTADNDLWSPAAPVTVQAPAPVQPSASQSISQGATPAEVPVAVQPAEAPVPTVSIAMAPKHSPTPMQIPTQEIAPLQEPVAAPTEPAPLVPSPIVAAPSGPAMATVTAEPAASTAAPSSTTSSDDSVAAAAEAEVAESPTPAAEPVPAPATAAQPQAGPEATAATDAVPLQAAVAASDIPEPSAPLPTPPTAPTPIAVTPPAPVERPRSTHSRYLVVPESIAVQADASFTARAAAPQQPDETQTSSLPQAASRSGSNAVTPLPATTTADRSPQSRPQGNGTQPRTPQRQGRQAQPTRPGAPANTVPPPRLGSTMFPNLSAGIDAIESRMRGEQPAQDQAPRATQARPLTVR